jgi:hypothetical protein
MGEMALVVLGLFVLVWIISAVVKASQDPGARRSGPSGERGRPRPADATPQRTSNSDIDRFMAEIDRLRRRGEGAAAGRPAESRPAPPIIERTPRPLSDARGRSPDRRERERERERERDRERRPRPTSRPAPTPAPPPLPRSEPVPVLRPVAPERPAPPSAPPAAPPKPARPTKPVAAAVAVAPPSPVMLAIQSLIKAKQGPAAALILGEIFGPPKGARLMMPGRRPG